MSACSLQRLVITNPVPVINPCSDAYCAPNDLTDPTRQLGILPYAGTLSPEQQLYNNVWQDLVRSRGVRMQYWRYDYDLTAQDIQYGEMPTAEYDPVKLLMGMAEASDSASTLARYGFVAQSDIKLIIPISEFERVFGTYRPKPQDLICIIDAHATRFRDFGPKIYEVRHADDESAEYNFLGGHYVWIIEGVRWKPSYEKGAPTEDKTTTQHNQISDDTNIGTLPGSLLPATPPKGYPAEIDEVADADFDQSTQGGGQNSGYTTQYL